jgi:type II secretory ATPase GspE/PulE/Tfp pilus assembly ATPase PilB-like protein
MTEHTHEAPDDSHGPATQFIHTSRRDESVVKELNHFFNTAARNKYTDLHFETQHADGSIRLRVRIDGILNKIHTFNNMDARVLVNKVRSRARLSNADSRAPQSGRFLQIVDERRVDVRVSIIVTGIDGVSIVCRLLDSENAGIPIEQLQMPPLLEALFRKTLARNEGMILTTGPTGSGKTTTLYAALQYLNTDDSKTVTAEDPIEYHLDGLQQVQVGDGTGRSFASALREFLRQDPDNILVGEIRDLETATIAAQAALTGHRLLSTLHTNSALETTTRLIDIGLPVPTIQSALLLIIAQRLMRKPCVHCCHVTPPLPEEIEIFREHGLAAPAQLVRTVGCDACSGTGYRGRFAIFEAIAMTRQFRASIPDIVAMKAAAELQPTYEPLATAALRKASELLTTLEEAVKIAYEQD